MHGNEKQELVKWEFQGIEVRTVDYNENTWWVAKDVCRILDIKNTKRAVSGLDNDERGIHTVNTPSGKQEMLIVNESGLYSLILRSRKQQAKDFRRWITHEVIPAIRRTGSYGAPTLTAEAAQVLVQTIREQEHKLAQVENDNQRMRHALYRVMPDNRKFGTAGKNGLIRIHPHRAYWQGHRNRYFLTSEEVQAVQLLLPLFAPTVEFQPQHELGF